MQINSKRCLQLLFLVCVSLWRAKGFRRPLTQHNRGRMIAFPRCPPKARIIPCICAFVDTEIHVRCENSEIGRIQVALDGLRRTMLPIEELYLIANRISSLPPRFFNSLQITKLYLMDNEVIGLSRNAFDGLENSLRHLYIREPLLKEVPFDTMKNMRGLRSISFEKTSLTHIPSLFSLPHLEVFKIDGSRIFEINPESFRIMPSLRKIEISNSKLHSLEDNSIQGFSYLKEIIYSDNNISWVHPGAFRNLDTVEKLSLEGNALEKADGIVVASRELKSLKFLNIARNKIRILTRGTFVDIPKLQEINLSNNILERIEHEAIHKLPSLLKLDLSNNNIYHFEANVFTDVPSLELLNLSSNNLSLLMDMRYIYSSLPNLKTLDLSSNFISGSNEISFGGHSKLEKLILSRNSFKKLSKYLFTGLPTLRELYLNQNNITRHSENRVWDLPSLQILHLSQNKLTKVDANLLVGIPNLVNLYLNYNLIRDISPKAFLELKNIKSLNLSYNKIRKLTPNTFKSIGNLYELDMSFNQLTAIDAGVLDGLFGLEVLYMSNNQIMNIDDKAFINTVKLKTFDLANNFIKSIPAAAIMSLSSLKKINFRNNAIDAIRIGELNHLKIMETIDLSNNHIQKITPTAFANMNVLKDLDLSVNYLQSIPSNSFDDLKMMEKLNISNNFILDIGNEAFSAMERLRILDLSNNSLTFLGQSIRNMPSLQGLFLSDNYISKLTNQSFINLPSLSVLFFCTNGLQTFETGTFYNLSSLMYLNLKNNSLVELSSYSFSSMKVLKEIKLNQNQISSVHDYAFMNLPSLQSLELQDNVIVHFSDFAFDRMPSLKFLNLSRNGLREMPNKCLTKVPDLDVLDLSWNYLTDAGDFSFQSLQWLTVLLLDHNDICHLSPNAFSGPRSLRVLALQNNQLKRLHLSALREPIESLSLLDMSENPFVCDCELIWLREYLQQEEDRMVGHFQQLHVDPLAKVYQESGRNLFPNIPSPVKGQPICAGPPEYAGMSIIEVPPQAFLCHEGFRDSRQKREKCASRFIAPQILTGDRNGEKEASGHALDTLLKLSNLTQIVPADEKDPSYLDYQNPIVVSGLSELINNFSKQQSFKRDPEKPIQKDSDVPNTKLGDTIRPGGELKNAGFLNSDFVTGDTPTIYAGGAVSSHSEKKGQNANPSGLFGFQLPALPNILESIGKIGLPNLGLNVGWGGFPFGRGSEGSPNPNNSEKVKKFRPQIKPLRGPDIVNAEWIEEGDVQTQITTIHPSNPDQILHNNKSSNGISFEKKMTEVTSNRTPLNSIKQHGRRNNTNYAKFYDLFSGPISKIGNQDKNTRPKQPGISFSEPFPNEYNFESLIPISKLKIANHGTPFLPGLIASKDKTLPFIPNRNFQVSKNKENVTQSSQPKETLPSAPTLKFPEKYDKNRVSGKWSPPDIHYPSLKSAHSFSDPFRPIKIVYPTSPVSVVRVNWSSKNTTNEVNPIYITTTTPFPISNRIEPLNKHLLILRNTLEQQQNQDDLNDIAKESYTVSDNDIMETTSPVALSTSISPFDDWTESFTDDFQATNLSNSESTSEPSTNFMTEGDLFEVTEEPRVDGATQILTSLPDISGTKSSTIQAPKTDSENMPSHNPTITTSESLEAPSSIPSTILKNSVITNEHFSVTSPTWLYLTESPDQTKDNISTINFVTNKWWPPASLGEGVTLVQRNSYTVTEDENLNKDESISHRVKHISPSRSIGFGSGIPSVKKVSPSPTLDINRHRTLGENEGETPEPVELITEAPSSGRKKAGIMDWYYSNYNKEYDPENLTRVGGNGPPPLISSVSSILKSSLLATIIFPLLIMVHFT